MNLDRLRAIADRARALRAPIQTVSVTVRKRQWSGGQLGLGTATDTDLVLAAYYKVRQLSAKEVSGSGGVFEMEDVRIGPITPTFTGGGYTGTQLDPRIGGWSGLDKEVIYVLGGAMSGDYRLVNASFDRPIRYTLVLRRVRQ